jgi:hypothetical protein
MPLSREPFFRPRLFYLLDYGIATLQKPKSSPAVFFPPLICVANKKKISVDHIRRAYKSAIPRGQLKCSAVLLLETSCARQVFKPSVKSICGCTWTPHKQ